MENDNWDDSQTNSPNTPESSQDGLDSLSADDLLSEFSQSNDTAPDQLQSLDLSQPVSSEKVVEHEQEELDKQTPELNQSFVRLVEFIKKEHIKSQIQKDPQKQLKLIKIKKYEETIENCRSSTIPLKGSQVNKAA